MIDGLVSGKMRGAAKQRDGKNGTFVTCTVLCAGGDGESFFVSAIAFADDAKRKLMALSDGDSICMTGPLTPKLFEGRDGVTKASLSMICNVALTAYEAKKRKTQVQEEPQIDGRREMRNLGRLHGRDTSDFHDDEL